MVSCRDRDFPTLNFSQVVETETSQDLKIFKLLRPRLIETEKFRGCRDRDWSRLDKSCRDWDFDESLAILCSITPPNASSEVWFLVSFPQIRPETLSLTMKMFWSLKTQKSILICSPGAKRLIPSGMTWCALSWWEMDSVLKALHPKYFFSNDEDIPDQKNLFIAMFLIPW